MPIRESQTCRLVQARTTAQFEAGRGLMEEYAAEIHASMGVDLAFQNFAAELAEVRVMYGPPSGSLVLATRGDAWVGCCALRRFDEGECEMKRLYVRPEARGSKLARRLAQDIVVKARDLGYRRMMLDTLEAMTAAQALYRSLGFLETKPYYFNPMAKVIYMELLL